MTPGRSRRRPERAFAPVSGAVLLLGAWTAVAHASGSGWVQAVGAVAAGLVVVGMLAPAVLAGRLELSCAAAPRDGETGSPLVVTVTSRRSLRCTPLFPKGRTVVVPAGTPTSLEVTPPHRGVLGALDVRCATAAPLGLLWWSVRFKMPLPSPVLVAPHPAGQGRSGSAAPPDRIGRGRARPGVSGELRGVRSYRHGDSRRLVHWRSTAHANELMVKELETQPADVTTVVAHLPEDTELAEARASEALADVVAALSAGRLVILETNDGGRSPSARAPGANGTRAGAGSGSGSGRANGARAGAGPGRANGTPAPADVARPVGDRLSAGRRLARAGLNPYGLLGGDR